MIIYYGVEGRYRDVTYLALTRCITEDNMITIPIGEDNRCLLFGDPVYGIQKHIKIVDNSTSTIYDSTKSIEIKTGIKQCLRPQLPLLKAWHLTFNKPEDRLEFIHRNMLFTSGNVKEEYPEQLMVAKYLPPYAKVLEIGANYGRNTLTIAALLEDESNFVSLECDKISAEIAIRNRDLNNYMFSIEASALSARPLYQKGHDTFIEENKPVDAKKIDTICWDELQSKYNIKFDTLVADCEGALQFILQDFPNMLDNINLLIVENDYTSMETKREIDEYYKKAGLHLVESKEAGWGSTSLKCLKCFYEVWGR